MLVIQLLSCALAVSVCIAVDITIGFEKEHYTVGEEEGRVEVCAAVLQGELQGAEQVQPTIDIFTGEGDDAGSQDFTTKTGKVFTFTSDIQRVCLDIEILEDEFVEGNETFTVVMLGFLVTLIPYRATVQIVDNDVIVIGVSTNAVVVSEDVGVVNMTVSLLQGVLLRPLVLQLFTVDGTSTAPADYTVINNNITFSTAVTEVHHSTSVVDDPYLEYDEQFFVRLQLLSVSIQDVNLSNNLSIGIMDNDVVTIGFESEMYNVTENEETIVVCVRLFEGMTKREFSTNAVVISGSSATDFDYSLPQTMVLPFNVTTSVTCLEIEVTDDLVLENLEQLTLQLSTSTTFIMLSPDTATINIADNDMVTVGFDSAIYNVNENEERVVVCVRLFKSITEREFSVNVMVVIDSTAKADIDYSLPHSMVLIFDETTSLSCLYIEVTDDLVFELPEQFTLQLYTSTASVVLSPDTATVNIADNDNGSSCPPEMLFTASGSYSWQISFADSMATLPCPIGPANVSATRQCNAQGNWLDHDASLCLDEFDLILTERITLENYIVLGNRLDTAVRQSVPSEQNAENIDNTASFLNLTAIFLQGNATAAISQEIVANTVGITSGIQSWPPETVREQGSSIIQSVESTFRSVVTHRNFTLLKVIDTNLAFRGERINTTDFLLEGHSFLASRSGATGNLSLTVGTSSNNNLNEFDISRFSISSEAFVNLSEATINFVFTFYKESTLFPVDTNRNSTIATPILGAFIPNIDTSYLDSPAMIYFRLNKTMNVTNHTCVSWDFDLNGGLGGWSPEGCYIVINQTDSSIVICSCNHLTNFAILVDICSRTGCDPIPSELTRALDILSVIGVSLSLFGVIGTIITLLGFRKLRKRDTTKFHIQLCAALFCMMLVFVIGIDRTEIYGGCVAVAVLIHYFTLVAVMWMGAEAILMFQKLVIVFTRITTKYIITVSIICWSLPLIPVIIPLAVNTDFMVSFNHMGGLQFCFIGDMAVFFGAFLGPIFTIMLFNVVIFVVVIFVVIKHTISASRHMKNERMNTKTAVRLIISISGVMFLFGFTWLFGALTVTGATLAFQVLFTIFNSLQGFFIFLFFCVFSKDVREMWFETLSCGRYHSSTLHPSQSRSTTLSGPSTKIKKTNSSGLATTSYATSTLSKAVQSESSEDTGHCIELPVKEPIDEKSQHSTGDPTMTTFSGSSPPVIANRQKTPVDMDVKDNTFNSHSHHSLSDLTTDVVVFPSGTTDEQKKSNKGKENTDSLKVDTTEANDQSPIPDRDALLKVRVQYYSTKKYEKQEEVDLRPETF